MNKVMKNRVEKLLNHLSGAYYLFMKLDEIEDSVGDAQRLGTMYKKVKQFKKEMNDEKVQSR